MKNTTFHGLAVLLGAAALACSPAPEGIQPSQPADTTVKMDFFNRPFPEIPLPNDVATRYDEGSATTRRINASMIAPTTFEARTRELIDKLDGWGLFQPIGIPFTGPLDVQSIISRHRDADYDTSDDAIFLVNVDRDSAEFGRVHELDIGNGNYPVVLEERDRYWDDDTRAGSMSLVFEETDEDLNRNGVLDPGEDANGNQLLDPGEDLDEDGVLDPPEDTDADGILDQPNYLPGTQPAASDLAARADALMTFYEKSTNTLIVRPMVPLRERTTYAVMVTRRVLDASGNPVGSPYPFVNHNSQTEALKPLLDVLPRGVAANDIAFAFSFTTQSVESEWKALRDGLYGHGVQAHLASEFPAEVDELLPMRDDESSKKRQLLYGENWKSVLPTVATQFLGRKPDSEGLKAIVEGAGYIDYFVTGTFQSPQLFGRTDAGGNPLPLNDQSWPADLSRTPAAAQPETVYFTLAVPRKEVSARGQGKPAPILVVGHGYTSQRFEAFSHASYFARHGVALLAIDGPSHGINATENDRNLARLVLGGSGLGATVDAIFKDRSFDQNNDGTPDSGADFWTAYLFHTRDIVRQFALDYMQLIRMVRGFDGERRWKLDTDGDGQPNLAGDFDGDGEVDIGQGSHISMFGGSLGGIMSMIMGAVEPEVGLIAPISGGGGLSDIGLRSRQGGIPQAFILRGMGPLYLGEVDASTKKLSLRTVVPDLNDEADLPIADVDGVEPWDTMLAENLANGERACAFVSEAGTVRLGLPSDVGDATRISFFKGPQLMPSEDCRLRQGAEPFSVLDTFQKEVEFQGRTFAQGAPLAALAEGLGLQRCHPDLRRFQGLGQLVLDPADPAVLAPHMQAEPMLYPGTGQSTGSHAMIISTMGDMSVPVNSGIAVGRASGLVDYLNSDPRYGKPVNQVLMDNYVTESVNVLKRFTNPAGEGVHKDVENFAQGMDIYGSDIPRLDPPLHIGFDRVDPLGGKSTAIFPYNVPGGQHGFDMPGEMTDKARNDCAAACTETGVPDPCACSTLTTFDVGYFMLNLIGRYMSSEGQTLSDDLCQSRNDCPEFKPEPAARDAALLE